MTNKLTFSQFREQEIVKYKILPLDQANDWQDEKSILQRKAFIEHDIRRKWGLLREQVGT